MINTYLDIEGFIIKAQVASILAYYTQGQGLLSQRRNNASYFYHYDGLGSTKALTDANQNIQNTTKYDAWGNILQSSGTITNPYLYVGELGYYGDGDAGMYLLTQRWYNPLIGRFVVRDPRWRKGVSWNSVNLFLYCQGNPVINVDPHGYASNRDSISFNECVAECQALYGAFVLFCNTLEGGPRESCLQIAAAMNVICTLSCKNKREPWPFVSPKFNLPIICQPITDTSNFTCGLFPSPSGGIEFRCEIRIVF